MPLDGIFLSELTREISDRIVGGRVDKIHQPARETIVIAMRAQGGNHKLLLCASASNPRIHFTTLPQDNPQNPPMFCMLMRKHLTGAKLLDVRQFGLDRVVHFSFETTNEFGDKVTLTLAAEIMGRHSNVILVDENNKVIDAVKRITDEMSRVRPVLPGMSYTMAPSSQRLDVRKAAPTEILERLDQTPELELSKALLQALEGTSPLVCREIAFNALRGVELPVSALNEEARTRLRFFLAKLTDILAHSGGAENGCAAPVLLVDPQQKPKDFSFMDIHQYGYTLVGRTYDTYSGLLDYFYSERDRIDRVHQRGADLLKLLSNLTDRVARKLTAQREELRESTERETLKIYGDLLSSNLHLLQKGMRSAKVDNYYADGAPTVEIPLDPMLTPVQNAQKYYTSYRKADTAEKKLRSLIEQGEAEVQYLESVFDELTRASTEGELNAIRAELASQGYVRVAVRKAANGTVRKGMKEEKLPPLRYRSDDGFAILCGRNNLQNERLTLRESRNGDVWFHTQKIPGSHVIVVTEGAAPPNRTLEQAAVIAAFHSKAREGGKVAVDYTEIRNVRKHPAGKPGLVLYEPFSTAIVEADEALIARLAEK